MLGWFVVLMVCECTSLTVLLICYFKLVLIIIMPDITMSLDDTLELDTIIRESSVRLNPVTDVRYEGSDSTVHNSTGLQTNTYIFEPEKPGDYTIIVNGQKLTIKVTDPSTIPDSGIFRHTWDSKNIVNGVLNDVWVTTISLLVEI